MGGGTSRATDIARRPGDGITLQDRSVGEGGNVAKSEKERLAAEVQDRWEAFQDALSNKRKYPTEQFKVFWHAGKRYAEVTKEEALIHRNVVVAINGLCDFLSAERKRIPESVLWDAQRLECLLFSGYDPYFEGDKPPGL